MVASGWRNVWAGARSVNVKGRSASVKIANGRFMKLLNEGRDNGGKAAYLL
jgi:hypothetical protein